MSGNAPPALDGVGDYADRLIEALVRARPEWSWWWLCRKPRWFSAPLVWRHGRPLVRPHRRWDEPGKRLSATVTRRLRPDVVHVQEQIHSFHESDAACRIARAGREAGAAVVTTLHEYHVERPSARYTTELVGLSDAVIANDARNAARCRDEAGRAPDRTWWSGANVPPADPSWGVVKVPGRLTTFGFLNALKGLGPVFEAIGRLRAAPGFGHVHWRIVGPFDPASDPHHAALAGQIRGDWVAFPGGYPRPDDRRLRTALAESEAMLLPFADGASPRRGTLQAAWAAGLPVVTTPPPAPEPDIRDGANVLLVREPTADAWADAIRRVLTDRALAERLRAGSREAAGRFSWDRLAGLHVALYEQILASRRPFPSPIGSPG